MNRLPIDVLACDVLESEIRGLAATNGWPVEVRRLKPSPCRILGKAEPSTLARCWQMERGTLLACGDCNPALAGLVAGTGAVRVDACNCIELLLGREEFERERAAGAFVLLEAWVRRWDDTVRRIFGTTRPDLVRELFQASARSLLCLRTPYSKNYDVEAERISAAAGLPLRWRDVTLEHLEEALERAMSGGKRRLPCPV